MTRKTKAQGRTDRLAENILESLEDVLSKEEIEKSRKFAAEIDQKLKRGAKFVPRKRRNK